MLWGTIIAGLISAAMTYYGTSKQEEQANKQNATAGLQYGQEQATNRSQWNQKLGLEQKAQDIGASQFNQQFAEKKKQNTIGDLQSWADNLTAKVNSDQGLKNNFMNIWARRA
jgi:glycine betaine/choline ABC-type transport system substrate-binding protein